MSIHRCHHLHEMMPSPMDLQPQACFVCAIDFMPNYQTMTCQQCNVSLCLGCVMLYTPETAFAMHLAKNGEPSALRSYTNNRDCATHLLRDPFLAPVYYEYQRFYNTDEYFQLLEERITNSKHEIECIKTELHNTQNRLSNTKLELLHARQRRRHACEANPRSEKEEFEIGLA
jgi:hypothetical protein